MKNTIAEIDEVMNIWLDSTIDAHDFIPEDYWRENYKVVRNDYVPQSETYVYIEKEKILGFISVLNKEFIGALFVNKNCQGNGIGEKLIDFSKSIYDTLSLSVYKKNYRAVNFYKKVGFKCIAEQVNEETNEEEYIMSIAKKFATSMIIDGR